MIGPTRVITIDGREVLVVERRPPLPSSLALLLEGGRDGSGRPWAALRVVTRQPLALAGARAACADQDHRLGRWLEGFHIGSDGLTRFLALEACRDCGAVCVRDQSFDSLDRLPTGHQPLRRRDHVMGWYSGSRARQRTYFGPVAEEQR